MKISKEHDFLLQTVKNWFNEDQQTMYYANELRQGPTKAEHYLLNLVTKTGAVLDVGCGAGRISVYMSMQGFQVTGVDISQQLLIIAQKYATQNEQNIRLLEFDGVSLPFQNNEFDLLIGFKILCYIPTRELRAEALREYYRVLKPGGTCFITQNVVPEEYMADAKDNYFYESPASSFQLIEDGDSFPLGKGYVHWFTEDKLLAELNSTDFSIEVFDSDIKFDGSGLFD